MFMLKRYSNYVNVCLWWNVILIMLMYVYVETLSNYVNMGEHWTSSDLELDKLVNLNKRI